MSQTASLKQQKPSSLKSAEAGNPPARCGEDRGPQAEENLFQTLPPLSVALDNLFSTWLALCVCLHPLLCVRRVASLQSDGHLTQILSVHKVR